MKTSVTPAANPPIRPADLRDVFRKVYGDGCRLYRAPGRINLIGEHTDYNQGFVMPAAIQFYCWVAIAATNDRKIEVHSSNLGESSTFYLDHPRALGEWSDYVQGVALMLEQAGVRLTGARMLVSSEVPIGSGLSSSAAFEVSAALALLDAEPMSRDLRRLALVCQRAENEFVGARCGIMDQFVACHGKEGHCLMLDCRSVEHCFLSVPQDVRLVVCNTMVRHENAAGGYNARRVECEQGVILLSRQLPRLSSLRDLSPAEFKHRRELLPWTIQRRCRHVINENQRVLAAAEALKKSDLATFGNLMAESHQSLRDDYEVSSPQLDLMVELANEIPGTYGARMTGGGFGGCTVNLVAAECVSEFQERIAAGYKARTGIMPEIYVSAAAQGAGRWDFE